MSTGFPTDVTSPMGFGKYYRQTSHCITLHDPLFYRTSTFGCSTNNAVHCRGMPNATLRHAELLVELEGSCIFKRRRNLTPGQTQIARICLFEASQLSWFLKLCETSRKELPTMHLCSQESDAGGDLLGVEDRQGCEPISPEESMKP
jgi:hypothetical protein